MAAGVGWSGERRPRDAASNAYASRPAVEQRPFPEQSREAFRPPHPSLARPPAENAEARAKEIGGRLRYPIPDTRERRDMDVPYVIVDVKQGTRDWLEWRHNGVGASDAPVVMGENPWRSASSLLSEKRGIPRNTRQNSAMARGTRLEPTARKAYESRAGVSVRPLCLQSTTHSWMRASVDGISADGEALVEIKCGESVYRKTASSRRVPGYYYGQLQHILALTGNDSIDFWCWLPGRSGLRIPVGRNKKYIRRLVETERAFWMRVTGQD